MKNATQRLLDRIRAANGGCSDYRVGKLMGVSTSAVSRWRTGVGHMSTANVTAACGIAPEDEFRWQAFIGAEREQGPEGEFWRRLRDDFLAVDAGRKPKKDGYLDLLINGLRGKVASILLGALVTVGLGALPAQRVTAATPGDAPQSVGYGKSWRKLRQWLKNKNRWPLLPQWTSARNRSTGSSRPRNWLHSLAAI